MVLVAPWSLESTVFFHHVEGEALLHVDSTSCACGAAMSQFEAVFSFAERDEWTKSLFFDGGDAALVVAEATFALFQLEHPLFKVLGKTCFDVVRRPCLLRYREVKDIALSVARRQ